MGCKTLHSTGDWVLRLHSCRALPPSRRGKIEIPWQVRKRLYLRGRSGLGKSPGRARLKAFMQDFELYRQILGLEHPWRVESVRMDRKAGEIEVTVECVEQVWGCPQCHQRMHIHDYEERRWRHLDSCQFKTIIRAKVPVVRCPEHGSQHVQVPWAEKYARFTRLFERLAIDLMLECSIAGACKELRISWDEADGIKQRAVARGLERRQAEPLRLLNIDEKSAGRGQNYVTVVAKVEPGKKAMVWHVSDGREEQSLDGFWENLTPEQLQSVEGVCIDMWDPFATSIEKHLPDAAEKITHDPFHIAQHMNDAVDTVRKQEHKRLLQDGDETLVGSKWHWLKGWENVPESWQERFFTLRSGTLKTARAWSIKEMLRDFWHCGQEDAPEYFDRWYSWAIRCRLEPVKKVARMIKKRLGYVFNYFKHRLTNGTLEGLNNRIQGLVKKAYGYRNRERFKTDIMFHLGGLDLYPSQ